MNHESIRDYCLSLPHTNEGLPFDEVSLVFKVHGKMFAILSLDAQPPRINLKNDPDTNIELRERYPCILPGYHMNKQHWNTVVVEAHLSWPFVQELIRTSYEMIYAKLPKKLREGDAAE